MGVKDIQADRTKRLAEIEANHAEEADARAGIDGALAGPAPSSYYHRAWLLREIREADAALTALGVPDDGRPLAERIQALWSHVLIARPRSEADREKARAARKEQDEIEARIDREMAETAPPRVTRKLARTPFTCGHCGGAVRPTRSGMRVFENAPGEAYAVPSDMPLLTCERCGEVYFNADTIAAIMGKGERPPASVPPPDALGDMIRKLGPMTPLDLKNGETP